MPRADDLVKLAMQHVGERYDLGADVPLDDPRWDGPWDCAEFASWLVYQTAGVVMGCTSNKAKLDQTEPYSGGWARDAGKSPVPLDVATAAATRGAVLVRKPTASKVGHVAISRGDGTTIEAMDSAHGVAVGKIAGRKWDLCCQIPGIDYP